MLITHCSLEGICLIEPDRFIDNRGMFYELFQEKRFLQNQIRNDFKQDNISISNKNVLRGLHYMKKNPQSQLLTVIKGSIFDVVVDIRPSSCTYGKWFGTNLSEDKISQIYMPKGFAHGFYVFSDIAILHYKVSENFDPEDDCGILWSDPDLNIDWPVSEPIVSNKDLLNSKFSQI
tara:strand:- start:828 stop:1355 length:528 start_codon:yes stop_codon:yes gene_type:complete